LAGILFIISAPSGSGKSTLVNQLRSLVTGLDFSVSYTTRAPRGSEQQDREYHYISPAKFQEMVDHGEFLEWANVFGHCYGTARRSLTDAQAAGKDLLLDIDVQGAAQVREKIADAVSIFVLPPNPQILATRLRQRSRAEGSLREDEIERRLAKARGEIENYRQYRYILVNDILDYAVESLTAIVIAERARRHGAPQDPETARMMQLADKCRQANAADRLYPVLSSFGLLDMHATRA
jgi:guanylate kinase